jgi:hypothetical protein
MEGEAIQQVIQHLEFLGYEVEADEKRALCRHQKKVNIRVRNFAGGVLFTGIFGCQDYAKSHRADYLDIINTLNAQAAVVRVYADEDTDFIIEAWHPDEYDRQRFGLFMELWDRDISKIFEADLRKFLN